MINMLTRDEARERVGRAIYGDDWIGGLRSDELELLSGPYGIRKKALPNGRPIDFIDVCPEYLRSRLDEVLGRQARCWAQISSTVDWMEDHGISVLETKVPRGKVDQLIELIRKNAEREVLVLESPKTGRPATADWDTAEAALGLEIAERGLPNRENEKGWQTQADVERWMHSFLSDRGEPAGDTTVRDRVRDMLKRLSQPR